MSMSTTINGHTFPVDNIAQVQSLQAYADHLRDLGQYDRLEQWLYAGAPQYYRTIRHFTPAGEANFREWFSAHTREGLSADSAMGGCLDCCADDLQRGDDLGYELSQFDTQSGSPAIYWPAESDFVIEWLDENGEVAK